MIEIRDIWQLIIFANGIIILVGFALIYLIAHLNKIKSIPFFLLPLSYLVGETIIILLLQFESFILGKFFWPLFPILALFAVFYLIFSFIFYFKPSKIKFKFRKPPAKFWFHLFFILIIIFFTIPNLRLAYFDLLTAWDARSIWFFHGKAFYYDNKIDASFLKNPAYGSEWSHPDYPPALPLLAAFHAHFLGRWHEVLNKSFVFWHWLFCLLSFYSLLQELSISPLISLMTTIIFQGLFSLNAHWGLADSFWSVLFVLGCLLIVKAWLLEAQDKLAKLCLQLSYFPLLLASLTKQEGTIAIIVLYLLAFLILWLNRHRGHLLQLIPLFMLNLFLISPWYLFTYIHKISSKPSLSPLGFLRFNFKDLAERINLIFSIIPKMRLIPKTLLLFIFLCLLSCFFHLFLNRRKLRLFGPEIFLLSLFFTYGFILFLIYLSTPHPLEWHLWTSLERTVIPLEMIALTLFALIARNSANQILTEKR